MVRPRLDIGVQLDLLERMEEAEGPTDLGEGHGYQSVLVAPHVVEGQVLVFVSLGGVIRLRMLLEPRVVGDGQRAGHRPVALGRSGVRGGAVGRGQRHTESGGYEDRLLEPAQVVPDPGRHDESRGQEGDPEDGEASFPAERPGQEHQRHDEEDDQERELVPSQHGDAHRNAEPYPPLDTRVVPEPVGEEQQRRHQQGRQRLRQRQLVGHPDIRVHGQDEGGDEPCPPPADLAPGVAADADGRGAQNAAPHPRRQEALQADDRRDGQDEDEERGEVRRLHDVVRPVGDVQVRVDEAVPAHEELGGVVVVVGVPPGDLALLGIDGVQPDGQADCHEKP